jgi:hypothetical protein
MKRRRGRADRCRFITDVPELNLNIMTMPLLLVANSFTPFVSIKTHTNIKGNNVSRRQKR